MTYKISDDPNMLYSFVNMMLRDWFGSLDDFCAEYDAQKETIITRLADAGFFYDEELNQFR